MSELPGGLGASESLNERAAPGRESGVSCEEREGVEDFTVGVRSQTQGRLRDLIHSCRFLSSRGSCSEKDRKPSDSK